MSQVSTRLYEFGAFRLDASERVLWRGDEMMVLPSKVFDTLWMLVKEEGRVVSKSELMEAIWTDAFVEESNVSQNIYTLRRTLGVDEQGRQFIETIPRRGYRFAVPVKLLVEASNGGVSANDSPAFAAIQTPLVSTSAPAEKVIRPRSALRYAIFAGLGILILSSLFGIGFGLYQYINRRGENEKIAPIEQVRFKRLTDSGDVVSPTISPNGELLAYVRHEEDQGSVWVKQIVTGAPVRILPLSRSGYRSLVFSPDGQYLFFREDFADPGAIYQTAIFGGTPKKVADDVWSDFSVSPDGKQFAFFRRDAARNAQLLILSNIEDGRVRELSARQSPLEYGVGAPAWSPDGSKLVVAGGLEQRNLLTVDVSTGRERELRTPRWRAIAKALWTPDGKHLIFSARATDEQTSQLWMLTYPDGPVRRLTNDLEYYFWLSLSADGRMLVTRQQKGTSHLWLSPDGDLKKARQLTFGGRNFDGNFGLAWTPDGKIIFSSFAGNMTDLYSMNPDGSNRVQLTANAGQDNGFPVVSNDGRYIVFTSNRAGAKQRQIWRMDIDGRNQKQLTFGAEEKDSAHYAALSPDGREVFYIRRGAGPAAIWKVSIEGGTPVPVSRLTDATADGYLSISPDGKWLTYHHLSAGQKPREEATTRIGALLTDGSDGLKLFDLQMRRPITQWSADSAAFYSAAGAFNSSSLWRQPLNGGEAQKLCDFTDRVFNFAWSRDGKNLVVSRVNQYGDALLITNLP